MAAAPKPFILTVEVVQQLRELAEEGLRLKDIAKLYGCCESTVKNRLRKAGICTIRAHGRHLSERFKSHITPDKNSGCWVWVGSTLKKGYGNLYDNGKARLATHVSLELDGQPRPSSAHWALHTCDNPPCVNPEHLYWGTAQDNFNDMVAKGRGRMDSARKDICIRGHKLSETAFIRGDGYRQCKECDLARYKERKQCSV